MHETSIFPLNCFAAQHFGGGKGGLEPPTAAAALPNTLVIIRVSSYIY